MIMNFPDALYLEFHGIDLAMPLPSRSRAMETAVRFAFPHTPRRSPIAPLLVLIFLAFGWYSFVAASDQPAYLDLNTIAPTQDALSFPYAQFMGRNFACDAMGACTFKPLFNETKPLRVYSGPRFDQHGAVMPGTTQVYQSDGHHRSFGYLAQQAFVVSMQQRGIPLTQGNLSRITREWDAFDVQTFLTTPGNREALEQHMAQPGQRVPVQFVDSTSPQVMADRISAYRNNPVNRIPEGMSDQQVFLRMMRKKNQAYLYSHPLEDDGVGERLPPRRYVELRNVPMRGVVGSVGYHYPNRYWSQTGKDFEEFFVAEAAEQRIADYLKTKGKFCFNYTSMFAYESVPDKSQDRACIIAGRERRSSKCARYLRDVKALQTMERQGGTSFPHTQACKNESTGGDGPSCRRCVTAEEYRQLNQTDLLHILIHLLRDDPDTFRHISGVRYPSEATISTCALRQIDHESAALRAIANTL